MKRLVILLTLLLSSLSTLKAQEHPTISLLTCGPTNEYVFYLYGHTAVRVQDQGRDRVYNYGYFSLEQKNFILNFVIGKPMYSLGVVAFDDFLYEYGAQGRSVVEQELNLKPDEARAIADKLAWNALPENRDYKYNFYFDNCATRPRDIIEEAVGGLEYRIDETQMPTFREAIRNHSYTATWYTTGADCCLGWLSDQQMTVEDAAFLPALLEQEFDHAVRVKDGEPLVISKQTLAAQTKIIGGGKRYIEWPFYTFLLIAILYGLLYFLAWGKHIELPLRVLRMVLYTILGISGVIIWFLAIASEHPHTFPNINMLLMHPLYFWLLATMNKKKYHKSNKWLYFGNFVAILIYFILSHKQVLPMGVPILAFTIGVDQFLHWRKEGRLKNKNE